MDLKDILYFFLSNLLFFCKYSINPKSVISLLTTIVTFFLLYSLSKEITVASEILRNRLNKEPTIKEIAFFLEKSEKDIEEAIISREIVLSCDYNLNNEDENKNVSLYDVTPYYEKMYDADYLDLYNEIEKLPDDEKELIKCRYFNDMTQSELAKKLGTNQVSICRKEEKILTKLNKSLAA